MPLYKITKSTIYKIINIVKSSGGKIYDDGTINFFGLRDYTVNNTFNDFLYVYWKDSIQKEFIGFMVTEFTTKPGLQSFQNKQWNTKEYKKGVGIVVEGWYKDIWEIGRHGWNSNGTPKNYNHIALVQTGNIAVYRNNTGIYGIDNKMYIKNTLKRASTFNNIKKNIRNFDNIKPNNIICNVDKNLSIKESIRHHFIKVETDKNKKKFCINMHRCGSTTNIVKTWSAGCQVFGNVKDLDVVMMLAKYCENCYREKYNNPYLILKFSYFLHKLDDNVKEKEKIETNSKEPFIFKDTQFYGLNYGNIFKKYKRKNEKFTNANLTLNEKYNEEEYKKYISKIADTAHTVNNNKSNNKSNDKSNNESNNISIFPFLLDNIKLPNNNDYDDLRIPCRNIP